MFGTLKPHGCTLDEAAHRRYRAYYCGLCQGMGRHLGLLGRAALSRDAVLVAILADGLQETPSGGDRTRCPVMPVQHRATRSPDAPALRAATDLQLLLGDQELADRAVEGSRPARLVRRAVAGPVDRARRDLIGLGVPADRLVGFELDQQRVEVPGETGPRRAAEPTAAALGLVFAALADLPGAAAEARTAATRDQLVRLGRATGRVIYLVDALDDLDRDRRGGAFNPLLVRAEGGGWRAARPRVRRTCSTLDGDLEAIRDAVARLPLRRNRDLVENVLCDRLGSTARHAAARARGIACGKPAGEDPRGSWTARWAAAAAVALFSLLGWAQRAAAAVPGWRTRLLASLLGWLRATDARAEEDEGEGETPADGGEDGGGGTGGEEGGDAGGAGGDDPVGGGTGSCSDCTDACTDCCDRCGGCGDTCEGCCNDCSDCGDCCNDCDDCGNCCNDCDDCGNCCNDCNC